MTTKKCSSMVAVAVLLVGLLDGANQPAHAQMASGCVVDFYLTDEVYVQWWSNCYCPGDLLVGNVQTTTAIGGFSGSGGLAARPPAPPVTSPPGTPPTPTFRYHGPDGDRPGATTSARGAAGSGFVMTMQNNQVRVQNRAGRSTFLSESLAAWWAAAGGFSFVFEPRVLYDSDRQRWVATACADGPPKANDSAILVAVSQSGDPTKKWNQFKIDADAENKLWADNPAVKLDPNWFTATFNMFTNLNGVSGGFSRTHSYVFKKAELYAGGTNYMRIDSARMLAGTFTP